MCRRGAGHGFPVDERHLIGEEAEAGKVVKRIALKYCGGCDCTYDRLEYAGKLKKAAKGRIEWVTMDDGGFDTILMIHGCPVACPKEKLGPEHPWRIISVIDDRVAPEEIINQLLERGGK
jgi:hypothetical protein